MRLDGWIREGIARPSTSDYASLIRSNDKEE